MADDVILNAGAGGAKVATDEIAVSLRHYQRVKLSDGAEGSEAHIGGDAANGLDVDVTRVTGTVTTDPSDRALRDVGKVDVAGLDQYTPQDTDTGAGTINALPVVLKAVASGGGDLGAAATPMRVDTTGTTAQPVTDNAGSLTVDNATLAVVGGGTEAPAMRVTLANDSTGVVSVDDNGGALTVDGTVTATAVGDVAHDGADSGNPVKVGAVARTADPTAVAASDRVNLSADTLGKLVVLPGANHDQHTNGNATFTTTTAADLIAAAGVGVRIAVTAVVVTNAHATVGTKVEIRDGTTVKIQGFSASAGGGLALSGGGRPLFISTANTAVTGRCVTTGADVDIFVAGYKIVN